MAALTDLTLAGLKAALDKKEASAVRRDLEQIDAEIERIEAALERIPSLGLVTDRGSSGG